MAGFKQLQDRMGVAQFNKYCATIASDYARSEREYAGSYFCDIYGISKRCFRQILEHAVIHYLVTDWEVNLMESKAQSNQEEHGATGLSSLRHYQDLREARRMFVFRLVNDFTKNEDKPLSFFLEKYGRGAEGLRNILEKAMAQADYYGLTPEMVETIQFRIFFEIVPAMNPEPDPSSE